MSSIKPAAITAQIVDLLSPLESKDRANVVRAALILLGESADIESHKQIARKDEPEALSGDEAAVPQKALIWMKQNGISTAQLQQAFHMGKGSADVIVADIPGNNKKQKTLNAYVFAGLSAFLASGEPAFDDKTARALCINAGCYDNTNHATTMKDKGNTITGSKDSGWVLTAPGLKYGAELVKAVSQ